jgi:hypothetical protein
LEATGLEPVGAGSEAERPANLLPRPQAQWTQYRPPSLRVRPTKMIGRHRQGLRLIVAGRYSFREDFTFVKRDGVMGAKNKSVDRQRKKVDRKPTAEVAANQEDAMAVMNAALKRALETPPRLHKDEPKKRRSIRK